MEKNILELCDIPGVCGNEGPLVDYIKAKAGGKYSFLEDPFGNLVLYQESVKNMPKIFLVVNMDEAGFIVSGIDKRGLIKATSLGKLQGEHLLGKRVLFQKAVAGVLTLENGRGEVTIDIGAKNFEEASSQIQMGDVASFLEKAQLFGDKIVARNTSTRLGIAILLQLMEEIKSSTYQLHFVFAAQGQLGNRGISVLGNYLKGDCILSLDAVEVMEWTKNVRVALKDQSRIYDNAFISRLENLGKENGFEGFSKLVSSKESLLAPFVKNSGESLLLPLLYEIKYPGSSSEMGCLENAKNLKTFIEIVVNSDIITKERKT